MREVIFVKFLCQDISLRIPFWDGVLQNNNWEEGKFYNENAIVCWNSKGRSMYVCKWHVREKRLEYFDEYMWNRYTSRLVSFKYHLDWSPAFLTSDDFLRSNEIVRTKWPIY